MALMPYFSFDQDFYNVTIPLGSGTQAYIDAKFEATTAHITNATLSTLNPDQLYISFASGTFSSETPKVAIYFIFFALIYLPTHLQTLALGTGDVQGMNQRLLPWLTERKGQRFGIISAFLL